MCAGGDQVPVKIHWIVFFFFFSYQPWSVDQETDSFFFLEGAAGNSTTTPSQKIEEKNLEPFSKNNNNNKMWKKEGPTFTSSRCFRRSIFTSSSWYSIPHQFDIGRLLPFLFCVLLCSPFSGSLRHSSCYLLPPHPPFSSSSPIAFSSSWREGANVTSPDAPHDLSLFFLSSTHDFSSSALLPFLRVRPWFKRTRLSPPLSFLFLSFSFLSQGLFF